MRFGDAPSRARRRVQPGDTIISTVRTYLRAVWPVVGATDDLVVSTGFVVLSPRPGLDARFLGWLAQSDLVIEEVVARSVGVSYPAINGLDVGELAVPVPSLHAQRAIAAYLDAETAAIDALLTARRHMLELLEERLDGFITATLDRPEWPLVPLKWRARMTVGIVVRPADLYVDAGLPCLRGFNIRPGSISDVFTSPHIARRQRSEREVGPQGRRCRGRTDRKRWHRCSGP